MKAAVLGIGTELTEGQISNRNASWISNKLKQRGLITQLHLVVPDDRELILKALEICAEHADLIFVTGGLGPTSDDFTRELISEWTQAPLVFDESSWTLVRERLTSRGYKVQNNQRQQCYFPQGSQILNNREGTAHGFYLQKNTHNCFILPGPPREIAAIWEDSIDEWLDNHTRDLDPYITRTWDTLGLGESSVAELIEPLVQDTELLVGYRVHLPYVEVKVSYWKSKYQKHFGKIQEIDAALKTLTITRDGKDIAISLHQLLKGFENIEVRDSVTGSYLLKRFQPALQILSENKISWSFHSQNTHSLGQIKIFNPKTCDLEITPAGENSCRLKITASTEDSSQILLDQEISSPYVTANMQERRKQYFAEMALVLWFEALPK